MLGGKKFSLMAVERQETLLGSKSCRTKLMILTAMRGRHLQHSRKDRRTLNANMQGQVYLLEF